MQWEKSIFVLCNPNPIEHRTRFICCHDRDGGSVTKTEEFCRDLARSAQVAKQSKIAEIWKRPTRFAETKVEERHQIYDAPIRNGQIPQIRGSTQRRKRK
ncbi:hypothetical protein SLE2022_142790 [Rubroshorea leprosula]